MLRDVATGSKRRCLNGETMPLCATATQNRLLGGCHHGYVLTTILFSTRGLSRTLSERPNVDSRGAAGRRRRWADPEQVVVGCALTLLPHHIGAKETKAFPVVGVFVVA